MDVGAWKVRLSGGTATVHRVGDIVLVAAPDAEAQQPFLDRVIEECSTAARGHTSEPGRRLMRKLAGLVAQADIDDVPTFGLLASLGEDTAAFLVGDVELRITAAAGTEVVSGRDVSTWLDRIVRAPFDDLVLKVPGAGPVAPRSDLVAGTVVAGGVQVQVGQAVAAGSSAAAAVPLLPPEPVVEAPAVMVPPLETAARAMVEEPTAVTPLPELDLPATDAPLAAEHQAPEVTQPRRTFQSISLAVQQGESAAPLPVAGADPTDDDQPQVSGIMCSRRHFNDPTAIYCSTCGISMVHQTHNLVKGRRPPLGVLVFDDGSVVPLNQDYVIGREPQSALQVADGVATPLQIDDPELKVSRVHALVHLKEWDVRIVDVGSANGTFVLKKGQNEWTRLVADEPATITPGTRVTMGGRTMEFDSHHK